MGAKKVRLFEGLRNSEINGSAGYAAIARKEGFRANPGNKRLKEMAVACPVINFGIARGNISMRCHRRLGREIEDSGREYAVTRLFGCEVRPETWAMMILGFCGLGFMACKTEMFQLMNSASSL
jgi:hypothetical protein